MEESKKKFYSKTQIVDPVKMELEGAKQALDKSIEAVKHAKLEETLEAHGIPKDVALGAKGLYDSGHDVGYMEALYVKKGGIIIQLGPGSAACPASALCHSRMVIVLQGKPLHR
tara:strand:- start:1921 stop:2262 length:342 start_codon:yes stop_codon:yes gene_type:complete